MEREPKPTEVLERAVRVLEALAEHPRGASLATLAEETQLPKSSLHRLLTSWEQLRYVTRLGGGGYQLGLAALELTRKVSRRNRLAELTQSQLRRLQLLTGESAYLAVYRKGSVILIDAVESDHPLRIVVDPGERCYLHASAQGMCVAAWLQPESLVELLAQQGMPKVTSKTDNDLPGLRRRLEEIRERGYAINVEQTVEGSVCLGAPVFAGATGRVLGSLGLSIPTPRATNSHIDNCLCHIVTAAREVSALMTEFTPEPDTLDRSGVSLPPGTCEAPRRSYSN